jgi:endonuclease/exonuclease/phosphatase family metal-dependent hydrolase
VLTRASIAMALALASGIACRPAVVTLPAPPDPMQCLGATSTELRWLRPDDVSGLDRWCSQVGSPLVVAVPAGAAARLTHLLIIGWNVHVGAGRVVDFIDWLRTRALAEGRAPGFVLLLQETFRAGGDIPPRSAGGAIAASVRPVRPTLDAAALGRYLGMSVAYVPSMRNGDADDPEQREDRGSAVLSTEPLTDIRAIELPLGRQRRVAVMATVSPRGASSPLRVLAVHLDTVLGDRRGQARALARRVAEIRSEVDVSPLLMSVDANAWRGLDDTAVKELAAAIPMMGQCGTGPTTAFLLRLDFVFSTLDASQVERCQTMPDEYGSDHRPIVVTLPLSQFE